MAKEGAARGGGIRPRQGVHERTDAQIVADFERGCWWLGGVVVATFGPMMLLAAWLGW